MKISNVRSDSQDLKYQTITNIKTINYTVPSGDLESGSISTATINSLTDATKNWSVNQWKDKVVKISCPVTSVFQYGLVLSNTQTTIVFDKSLLNLPSNTCVYRIIPTVAIDKVDLDTIVAIDNRLNDCGVVLPNSVDAIERKYVHVYNELSENGTHQTIIMCRGADRQLGFPYGELNHRYEGVRLHVHTWNTPHWDVLQVFNVKRFAGSYWSVDESISSVSFAYLGDTGKLINDKAKRFLAVDVDGKQWLRYTSLVPSDFRLQFQASLLKSDGGSSTIEISFAKKDGVTGVVTELTERIGVARLSVSGEATAVVDIPVSLKRNDEIIAIARRTAGAIVLQTGSSIDIIEL